VISKEETDSDKKETDPQKSVAHSTVPIESMTAEERQKEMSRLELHLDYLNAALVGRGCRMDTLKRRVSQSIDWTRTSTPGNYRRLKGDIQQLEAAIDPMIDDLKRWNQVQERYKKLNPEYKIR
jgi:hypothetical protein